MASKKLYYCGGYGGTHIIPGAGRHFFSCSKCRWSPNYRDTDEHKARVIASMQPKAKPISA